MKSENYGMIRVLPNGSAPGTTVHTILCCHPDQHLGGLALSVRDCVANCANSSRTRTPREYIHVLGVVVQDFINLAFSEAQVLILHSCGQYQLPVPRQCLESL